MICIHHQIDKTKHVTSHYYRLITKNNASAFPLTFEAKFSLAPFKVTVTRGEKKRGNIPN